MNRKIPDGPNTEMSAMNLCIKLIFGGLMKGANILVTTKPTAEDFYSKLDFERNVEIIVSRAEKLKSMSSNFVKITRQVNLHYGYGMTYNPRPICRTCVTFQLIDV